MLGFLRRKPKQDKARRDVVEGFSRRQEEHRRTAIGLVDRKQIVLLLYQTMAGKWNVLVSGLMSFEIESEEFKKKEEADNYFDGLVKKHKLSEIT